jgi:epoxyqueuosine reductase
MDRFIDDVFDRLGKLGYKARMVSIDHLPELKKQIVEQRSQELLDNQFYQERLAWFRFQIPESLPNAGSMIIVAVPRPQTRAVFTWNGIRRPLILPPTYTADNGITEQVQNLLAKMLSEKGYAVVGTALPLKLLATRSGLSQYGRNNISYVPGMGSFLQLVGAYSDMPCEEDSWQEPSMLQACEKCDLCRRACPTGAIPSDRFLLRAERCISYHNEKKGDIPFPSWMDVRWHNCIEGCMRCQRACPVDKHFLDWVEDEEEFSEEETALLLEGASRERLHEETVRKLANLDILNDLGILPRNLGVFFRKHEL